MAVLNTGTLIPLSLSDIAPFVGPRVLSGTLQLAVDSQVIIVGSDSIPVITVVSPVPGQPITRQSVVLVNATSTVGISRVFVYVRYSKPSAWEVVFDGESWGPAYQGPVNTRTTLSDGYQFRILRDGGWQQTPNIAVVPVDAGGNGP